MISISSMNTQWSVNGLRQFIDHLLVNAAASIFHRGDGLQSVTCHRWPLSRVDAATDPHPWIASQESGYKTQSTVWVRQSTYCRAFENAHEFVCLGGRMMGWFCIDFGWLIIRASALTFYVTFLVWNMGLNCDITQICILLKHFKNWQLEWLEI